MAIGMVRKQVIGRALVTLADDVATHTLALVREYRVAPDRLKESLMKQAIDTPARARAQLQAWIDSHNGSRQPGVAQSLLAECLIAAGSTETLAQISTALAALEAQAQALVQRRNVDGWDWDQIADAIEAAIVMEKVEDFVYSRLPVPPSYVTVWGEPW